MKQLEMLLAGASIALTLLTLSSCEVEQQRSGDPCLADSECTTDRCHPVDRVCVAQTAVEKTADPCESSEDCQSGQTCVYDQCVNENKTSETDDCCAASDPCGWTNDGFCDDYCGERLDDWEDCERVYACRSECVAHNPGSELAVEFDYCARGSGCTLEGYTDDSIEDYQECIWLHCDDFWVACYEDSACSSALDCFEICEE